MTPSPNAGEPAVCPWCQTSAFLHIVVETSRDKKRTVPLVACGQCGTGGPKPFCLATYDERSGSLTDACQEKAWAAWNRRAAPPIAALPASGERERVLEEAAKLAELHCANSEAWWAGAQIAAAIRSLISLAAAGDEK